MAKSRKTGGFGSLGREQFSIERPDLTPPPTQSTATPEPQPRQAELPTRTGTKPTWKDPAMEYKRMSFYVSAELRRKIKLAVATEERFMYQDALVNAALEEFFAEKGG